MFVITTLKKKKKRIFLKISKARKIISAGGEDRPFQEDVVANCTRIQTGLKSLVQSPCWTGLRIQIYFREDGKYCASQGISHTVSNALIFLQ